MIIEQAKAEVMQIEGISNADIELTFEPPWQPPEELRMMMGV